MKFKTKFDYFKNWMQGQGYWEAWEKNEIRSDWSWRIDNPYRADISREWDDHLENINWDDVLIDEGGDEHVESIDATEAITNKEEPNYTLENILGFYYSITQKNYVETEKDKELIMNIIDVANSWGDG